MLTAPTAFADFQNRTGASRNIIVKLTDGTNTFYLGTAEAQLTDGHVYPLIQSFSGVLQQLDIFSKQWAVNTCQIIFSNTPYRQDSTGAWVRLSDELSGILFNDASVHLLCGEDVKSLSDCLTIFSAKVLDTLYYDDKTIRVTLHDKSPINNIMLPQNKISTTYPSAPAETASQKVPLVYGDFNQDFIGLDRSGTGLAVALKTHPNSHRFVVSDHILDAITEAYIIPEQTNEIAKLTNKTLNVNDGGDGTITGYDFLTEAKLYPSHNDDADYDNAAVTMDAIDNVVDRDIATSLEVKCHLDPGIFSTVKPKGLYMMGFNHKLLEDVKDQSQAQFKLSTYADDNVSYTITSNKRRLYFHNSVPFGDQYYEENMSLTPGYDDSSSWQDFPLITGSIIGTATWISVDPPVFTGSGKNDLTSGGFYSGADFVPEQFEVEIDAEGTPDTFKWRKGTGSYTTGVSITGSSQTLQEGVTVTFDDTTNHVLGDVWIMAVHDDTGTHDNMSVSGTFTSDKDVLYKVIIVATAPNFDFYDVYKNGVKIREYDHCDTAAKVIDTETGTKISFATINNHDIGDNWTSQCYAPQDKNADYMMAAYVEGKESDAPISDDHLFILAEARLFVRFIAESIWPIFAECKGREYSSWITGRSSNYAVDAIIEDPAGIIESLLRDEVGLVDADIDMPSFIISENASVKSRINLFSDNEFRIDEIIRQLAEQSTFAYVWSASGKARLIDLDDISPTTNRTIPYSHIVDGRITVSQTSEIVNDITINSRWQQEYEAYANRDNFTDATSQTTYGVRKYEAEWPNVAGASVTVLKDHYVDGANAIWIDAHNVIEIETAGFTNADLEIGDWIELDASSVDSQVLCFGNSWAGKQFLVVELTQNRDSTRIKAIELH